MTTIQGALPSAVSSSIESGFSEKATAEPAVSAKTWLAVIGATLGAFMAVLNIQIVNASLADIQGAIGAGIDDGGWISTTNHEYHPRAGSPRIKTSIPELKA